MLSLRFRAEGTGAFGHETADGMDGQWGIASGDPQVPRGAGRIGFRSSAAGFPFWFSVLASGAN
jgi:hypothetical protein